MYSRGGVGGGGGGRRSRDPRLVNAEDRAARSSGTTSSKRPVGDVDGDAAAAVVGKKKGEEPL